MTPYNVLFYLCKLQSSIELEGFVASLFFCAFSSFENVYVQVQGRVVLALSMAGRTFCELSHVTSGFMHVEKKVFFIVFEINIYNVGCRRR